MENAHYELVSPAIQSFVESYLQPESDILRDLNDFTQQKAPFPEMLAGHYQGELLRMFSKMIQPAAILEIGTYTGYSAICLSDGLRQGGVLHTIEANEELAPHIHSFLERAGLSAQVTLHIGDARKIVPALQDVFDLVFIDADKPSYALYYDLVFDKIRPGGYIIADNILWRGKITDESATDRSTVALREYVRKVHADERVENIILPIRDGLMVARKK
ncbi:methyltransferase [Chitinophaga sp. MD30]|nr:methyltransferase [Chitinophaga sp. MD30]